MKERINFNKNCKIHLCCERDDYFRPIMQNIFFDKGNAVASDGHVLIIAPIDEISNFPQDQRELLNGKFIHWTQYEKILKFDLAEIHEDGIICKTVYGGNSNIVLSETKFLFQKVEKYPDYKAIIPVEICPLKYIGIRSDLLLNISNAVGKKNTILYFNSSHSAILVHFPYPSNAKGVIMPFEVNER